MNTVDIGPALKEVEEVTPGRLDPVLHMKFRGIAATQEVFLNAPMIEEDPKLNWKNAFKEARKLHPRAKATGTTPGEILEGEASSIAFEGLFSEVQEIETGTVDISRDLFTSTALQLGTDDDKKVYKELSKAARGKYPKLFGCDRINFNKRRNVVAD